MEAVIITLMSVLLLIIILLLAPLASFADGHVAWPASDFTNSHHPDDGIVWFALSPNNGDYQVLKASPATAKGEDKRFYDPTKPTLIYFHGWQADGTVNKHREDMFYHDPYKDINYDLLSYWKAKGWNVGYFYWNQFADEGEITNSVLNGLERAEAKIYISDFKQNDELIGMRWAYIDKDGKRAYSFQGVPKNENLTQIALHDYLMALHGYQGPRIRLAGHSMGAQLVMNLTGLIANEMHNGIITDAHLLPKRVAFLDPFFSMNRPYYLHGESIARNAFYTYSKVHELYPGIVFTMYISSSVHSYDSRLAKRIAYETYRPDYITFSYYFSRDGFNVVKATIDYNSAIHNAARYLYFASMNFAPPLQRNGAEALSASVKNQRVSEIEGDGFIRLQIKGLKRFLPDKDMFKLKAW